MINKTGVWCVVLASREIAPGFPEKAPEGPDRSNSSSLITRDPLEEAVRRAHTLASRASVGAVVSARGDLLRQSPILQLPTENVFVQPDHHGTAYEVLLALLSVSARMSPETPIIFLPSDHVVSDEEVMTSSLTGMAEWMGREPNKVYLLGAVPEGPHDQLGYIVPWYDAMNMASDVYEFVEAPDMRQARKLINAGGLWNTFIFGGTWSSLLALYRPRFDAAISALRAALDKNSDVFDMNALRSIYDRLTPADFSKDLLVPQIHRLSVLRMPRCGWWPLKSPTRHNRLRDNVRSLVGLPPDGTEASEGR
jgi:mannose-1-phosphate guanylyltransferase